MTSGDNCGAYASVADVEHGRASVDTDQKLIDTLEANCDILS